jgi:uncharacterized protein YndB with AHSA1/START domain
MEASGKKIIIVKVTVNTPVEKVWNLWTDPLHIIQWNKASDDWHTPMAESDLRVGGRFLSRMEARDGSSGFDFTGIYRKVEPLKLIEYNIADGRNVKVTFVSKGDDTEVTETFEAEGTHPVEMQSAGWQAILNNFKKHAEESV